MKSKRDLQLEIPIALLIPFSKCIKFPTMAKKLYTAIVYTIIPQVNGSNFLKYRNINDKDKFMRFAAKFPGAQHVNFYEKETRSFDEQRKFN